MNLEAQCWICPQCHDDHSQDKPCTIRDKKEFIPHASDRSYIAEEYRARVKELTQLRSENAVMREALEKIARNSSLDILACDCGSICDCGDTAEAARARLGDGGNVADK